MWGFVLIVFVFLVIWFATLNTYVRADGVSYVSGAQPGVSGDGYIFLGTYPARADCETACDKNNACNYYTWHDPTTGAFSNQCYGTTDVPDREDASGRFSGKKVPTYSNTLQRVYGMMGAGSKPESFQDIAHGTLMSGYHRPTTLPY